MNWDDLRFVLALAKAGSLARAAKALRVDHTTVGRRIDAVEADLGVRLFTRTTTGYVLTAEAETLLPEIERVEASVLALERGARARSDSVEGLVRVTSGETFGGTYLAPRLAAFGREHPGLTVELVTGGVILDLARREADIAVRFFRSPHESLVVRRAAEMAHGLYASPAYLGRKVPKKPADLRGHRMLTSAPEHGSVAVAEAGWVEKLTGGATPAFVSNLTVALLEAARAGAGIAVLPRYLGDADPSLQHVPMPDEPRESIWITVHRDLKQARRVRAVLDFLRECFERDRELLLGR
ncbi:MAG: LysR family transcriptional regulator [Polyangiaceae bacterium]|nr:LysR family transcriptional regulator [Polyangiaceae bacterium]